MVWAALDGKVATRLPNGRGAGLAGLGGKFILIMIFIQVQFKDKFFARG